MEVEKVTKWVAPEEDGAPLLCMPNLPKPLHSLAPRTIVGQARWNIMRTKCYMDADYTCQACGKYLGIGKTQAHELYSINYENQTSKFERCVTLCGQCHELIHSGRTYTLYRKGDSRYNKDYLLKLAKRGMKLVWDYNASHPENQLKMYGTLVEWAKDEELGKWLKPMIEQYDIKFYAATDPHEDKKSWGKWRLLYDGKKYEPKYKDAKEWEEAMK